MFQGPAGRRRKKRGAWLLEPVNPLSSLSAAKPSVTRSRLSTLSVVGGPVSRGGRNPEPWLYGRPAKASSGPFTSGSFRFLISRMGLVPCTLQSCCGC